MKRIFGALTFGLAIVGAAAAETAIPAQFVVCVTTVDAKGRARVDSFWSEGNDAGARRVEILRDGWVTVGDEPDRVDAYPPHSIVKVTIDPTLVNQTSCLPPPDGDRLLE